MADDATAQGGQAGGLVIPADVQQKFGELITLIKGSESMNDEERQYWINILPIMTPEQLQNLKDILVNEKEQLAAIDAKYQTEIDKLGQTEAAKKMEEDRRRKRTQRTSAEESHKEEEAKAAEALLSDMDEAGK
jgi:hypothetical protein